MCVAWTVLQAREVMRNRRITCELIAKACGKPLDVVEKDASRKRYFSPEVRTVAHVAADVRHIYGCAVAEGASGHHSTHPSPVAPAYCCHVYGVPALTGGHRVRHD